MKIKLTLKGKRNLYGFFTFVFFVLVGINEYSESMPKPLANIIAIVCLIFYILWVYSLIEIENDKKVKEYLLKKKAEKVNEDYCKIEKENSLYLNG